MNEQLQKNNILSVFRHKNISDKKFYYILSKLEEFKNSDPLFYYFTTGKFITAFGYCNDAIPYLEEAIKLDDKKAPAYYNLYKCYIRNYDFEKAYSNLCKCNEYEVRLHDFTFPFQLLCAINDIDADFEEYRKSDYSIPVTNSEGYNVIKDKELNELHNKVIEAFNNRKYNDALEHLEMMSARINEINYPMEVDTLIFLVEELKEKECSKYSELFRYKELDDISEEEYADDIMKLYELGIMNEENILRKISKMLDSNFDKAKELLSEVSGNPHFSKHKDIMKYLNGIVKERDALQALDSETLDEYLAIKNKARSLFMNRRYGDALQEYSKAKEVSGLVVCDYYIGKVLFRQKKYGQAKRAFLNYLKQGGEKLEKTYMFLGRIESVYKKKNASNSYFNRMDRLNLFFDKEFFCRSDRRIKENDPDDNNDLVKKKRTHRIHMKVEDFKPDTILPVEDFYDVDLEGKLSIIKGLFQIGNVKVANKLFSEVQRECVPEERGKVMQFEKNKKIYMNQKRTTC